MRKKGFTLLELLIIIVVLIIIFLFSIPIVKMVIENSKFGAFENSVYSAFDAIDNYMAANKFVKIPESGMDIALLDEATLKNNNFDEGLFVLENNALRLVYIKQGKYCAKGTKAKLRTTDKGCGALDDTKPIKANVFVKNTIGNTMYLVAAGYDPDGKMIKYELSIDGKPYYTNTNQLDNVFKVEINDNKEHIVKVRVTNESNLSLESEKKIIKLKKTYNINLCEVNDKEYVSPNKSINFKKEDNIEYAYSYDLKTWNTIKPDSKDSKKKINNDIKIDSNKIIYIKCKSGNDIYYNTLNISNVDSTLNGSYPKLLEGMIPVIYSDGKWVIANKNIKYWDYDNKIWANIVFVRKDNNPDDPDSKNRNYYMSDEAIGEEIYKNDILAYYVWIPRYSYKIWNLYGKNNNVEEIKIKFGKTKAKNEDVSEGDYINHNAFSYNNSNGFWVSKYKHNAKVDTDCYLSDNCDKSNLKIYSTGDKAITSISISNASKNSRNLSEKFNEYGLDKNSNSHLITNLEWGSIAYLVGSKYGEINESTTGNETGVFGMGSGSEYVMANYNNTIGSNKKNLSGFKGSNELPKDYIDIYKSISIKSFYLGDAILETNEWTEKENKFVNSSFPFLERGKNSIYSFSNSTGAPRSSVSFRSVITK